MKNEAQKKIVGDLVEYLDKNEAYPLFTVFLTEDDISTKEKPNQIRVNFQHLEARQLMENEKYKAKVCEVLELYLEQNKRKS